MKFAPLEFAHALPAGERGERDLHRAELLSVLLEPCDPRLELRRDRVEHEIDSSLRRHREFPSGPKRLNLTRDTCKIAAKNA